MSASVQTVFLQFLWGICTFWATIHRTTQLGIPGARTGTAISYRVVNL
jgi:hypothetical protein